MNQVRKHREKAGLSQTQLARKTGLSQSYLSAIEIGLGSPSAKIKSDLSQALDVPEDELFLGNPDEFIQITEVSLSLKNFEEATEWYERHGKFWEQTHGVIIDPSLEGAQQAAVQFHQERAKKRKTTLARERQEVRRAKKRREADHGEEG